MTRTRRSVTPAWPVRLLREQGGFVPGFLTRTVLSFAVLAIVGHDVGQIVWTQIQVSDAAHKGARAAANNYYILKNQARAEQEALGTVSAENKSIQLVDVQFESDGSVWTKTTEEATTFVFGRIGFLKGFTMRHAAAHEERSSF